MLTRDTEWRQGDLLTKESSIELGLLQAIDEEDRVIVVTHDCDIPHEAELFIEVIIAKQLKNVEPDPNLSYAKNPRRLHLIFKDGNAASFVLELNQVKKSVLRANFAQHAVKDNRTCLSSDEKRVLKLWMAARYGRPAFANAFEDRLRKSVGQRRVDQYIFKILEPKSKHLIGLFFNLGEQRGKEEVEGIPFGLSILVVYDGIEGGYEAREAAEQIAEQLRTLFNKAYGNPASATEIALDTCEAVSDTHVTLFDLRRMDQWRLEHVSLRDKSDFLSVGETPV